MNLDCARCGAHVALDPDSDVATCPYCGATKLIERAHDTPDADTAATESVSRTGSSSSVLGKVGLGLGVAAAVVGIVVSMITAGPTTSSPPTASAQRQDKPTAPEETAPAVLEQPPAPVVSRPQAIRMLEPELLSCMKQHKVHYFIVRIGQGYDAPPGLYPPLVVLYDNATVEYREVQGFSATPLGRCVVAAAARLWTDAPRGAYMHFGLRNPDARDPLAGKPRSINQALAHKALGDLDEAARDCGRRQLPGFKPGRDLSMIVRFRGIDGQVEQVEPYYIDEKSPYDQCIRAAYKSATVPQFRELSDKVLHKLRL
ncbi:MAG: hypothetical protein ABIJ09_15480 [Pseudomonadota bacterium]